MGTEYHTPKEEATRFLPWLPVHPTLLGLQPFLFFEFFDALVPLGRNRLHVGIA